MSRRVMLTGGAGRIASSLRAGWKDRYMLRSVDRVALEGFPAEEVVCGDVTNIDFAVRCMQDVDTVVHLAADSSVDAPWSSVLRDNIEATYVCYEAARVAGVRRVVFASSNHVMGNYDRERRWPVDPSWPVRPDSLYGASKAFGEALGSHYSNAFGLSVICLRLGWFARRPTSEDGLWMWLSPRDALDLFTKAIECDVAFGVYYGASRNTRLHWDISNAIEELGYAPQDDAEVYA